MACFSPRTIENARFICPCVLTIVALFTIPIGISMIADAGLADVATQFTALGKVCNVSSIRHWTKTVTSTRFAGSGTSQKKYFSHSCWDYYIYDIDAPTLNGTNFTSRSEGLQRTISESCAKTTKEPAAGSFALGQIYDCWVPSPGYSRANLPAGYKCGNEVCVKLFNPEKEIENVYAGANGLLLTGGICLAVAFLFCSYSAASQRKMKPAGQRRDGPVVVSGVPVATGTTMSRYVSDGQMVDARDRL